MPWTGGRRLSALGRRAVAAPQLEHARARREPRQQLAGRRRGERGEARRVNRGEIVSVAFHHVDFAPRAGPANFGWVGKWRSRRCGWSIERPHPVSLWISTTEPTNRADDRAQTAPGTRHQGRPDRFTSRFGAILGKPSCPTVDIRHPVRTAPRWGFHNANAARGRPPPASPPPHPAAVGRRRHHHTNSPTWSGRREAPGLARRSRLSVRFPPAAASNRA